MITGDLSYIASTVIDGDSAGPVAIIAGGENTTCMLIGFTIQNGQGGILCYRSDPVIFNNIIKGNHTGYLGGGIHCEFSNPSLNNNLIFDNSAEAAGGGIYCSSSNPTLGNNLIFNNYAGHSGGGIYLWSSNPVLNNNTISGNSAYYFGGGIRVAHSSPTVLNTILWADSAQYGAEIHVEGMPVPVFKFCDIELIVPAVSAPEKMAGISERLALGVIE
jgi:parallel beta-helix repeat protein